MASPDTPRIEGSEITQFVLSKIDSFEELNASTADESERKFDEILLSHIPVDLTRLPRFQVDVVGMNIRDLYLLEERESKFLIKEMKPDDYHPDEQGMDLKLQLEKDNFQLVDEYFHDYLPHTVFAKRTLETADGGRAVQHLVVQDIGEGTQFKGLLFDRGEFPQVDEKLKIQLQDVINRTVRMLEETGQTIDLDFMIDTTHSRIVVFDTGNFTRGRTQLERYALRDRLETIARAYNLTVPELP